MSVIITKSTPEVDAAAKEHIAKMMAKDLLEAGVNLSDREAVVRALSDREYSRRCVAAIVDSAIAEAKRRLQ